MLKAVITLNEDPVFKDERSRAGGVVHLTSLYRYGSHDLLDLATAVKVFYQAGDEDVKRILNRRLFFPLYTNPQAKTLPLKVRWNDSPEAQKQRQSIVRDLPIPHILARSGGNSDHQDAILVDAFLDVAYWQSREEGDRTLRDRLVTAWNVTPKQMLLCARAGQKTTALHPRRALATWELTSVKPSITPSALAEIDRILAVGHLPAGTEKHQ